MGVVSLIVAPVSELEANERGSSLIGRRSYIVQNARNCVSGKIKGAKNCGCARMEKLAYPVVHVFTCVEECSKERISQLCKLLVFTLSAGYFTLLLSFILA